jgi:hypothetical protein
VTKPHHFTLSSKSRLVETKNIPRMLVPLACLLARTSPTPALCQPPPATIFYQLSGGWRKRLLVLTSLTHLKPFFRGPLHSPLFPSTSAPCRPSPAVEALTSWVAACSELDGADYTYLCTINGSKCWLDSLLFGMPAVR